MEINEDFKEVEKKCKELWEKEKIYKFNINTKKKIYSVDTPPPTVSGKMHIGHACSYSQQDFIIRFKRMKGYEIFYPFGTDDNGLPTERLVERSIGIKAKDIEREKFIQICLDFLKKETPSFIQDWKDLGISCDWDLSYSTINSESRKISQNSFLDLYKIGRAYRKDAPSMWCPECKTGVAQVEVQDKEVDSFFNEIVFKVENKSVIIATTRPEFLASCVAIFYHPEDKRYKYLKNKKAIVPIFNFEVPILEDKRVDKEKGTGIVMCCTFGDQTDMEWQKAYNLPIKISINEEGVMTNLVKGYEGLTIKEARKKIIEDLKEKGLLIKQKPIKHFVNVHERCGTEIEFIKSKQWFIKYLDLKEDLLKWGAELKWYPEHMKNRYDNWVKGLQWDWLVSNQRYFGVPFPVWYCKNCNEIILADKKQLPVDPLKDKPLIKECPKCKSKEFIPEKDILNTWFTSSMTPQIAINTIKDEEIKKKLFPMDLRPQAHDIITFWLFNTLLKSSLHYGKNPWKNVMISGFITFKGEKMSKSKGNTVDPREILDKYGADPIRYWAASSKLGEDLDYQEKDLITGKKLIKKITNAANFIFMQIKEKPKNPDELIEFDRIFLLQLNKLIEKITVFFENYEYGRVKSEIENFFWNDFTDNYLEIVKNRVYNGDEKEKDSAFYTLYTSFLNLLKMFAPFICFTTEEVYQNYYKKYEKIKSIHLTEWPEILKINEKKDDNKIYEETLNLIYRVRQQKSLSKKSMKTPIEIFLEKEKINLINPILEDFKNVTNAIHVKEGDFLIKFIE